MSISYTNKVEVRLMKIFTDIHGCHVIEWTTENIILRLRSMHI